MNLDSAYIEPLIDDWTEYLQQIVKEQEKELPLNIVMPFTAIPPSTIETAFKIADYLKIKPNVKYMAIQLYNKFMCCRFSEIYRNKANDISEVSWIAICKETSQKAKLYLMSCFQLTCKMDSPSNSLGIPLVLHILYSIDDKIEYKQNMIFTSEIEVYKTVGFKMPLCTPFQCIEILLAATGLRETPNTFNISIDLLDLAYLKHDTLYSKFHLYYIRTNNLSTEFMTRKLMLLKSNILFLSAAIVLCTTTYLEINDASNLVIIAKLAELSNTEDTDIYGMANILFLIATEK